MEPEKNQWIIWVALAIVVLCVGGFFIFQKYTGKNIAGDESVTPENNTNTEVATRGPVPARVVIPEEGSNPKDVPSDTAIPLNVSQAAPNSVAEQRTYKIIANGGMFTPRIITVRQGDTVRINIEALDRDYDVVQPDYGWKQTILKGETKPVGFQATGTGTFLFYCELCGGPENGPTGSLVVVPRE